MPNVFSRQTLAKFEDASASIPIRQLDRAFEAVDIRLGKDPGGPDGTRRVQFRRYVASVDQRDGQAVERLGDALGALIDEVATSKQEFLVKAAERDGFRFANGVFRPAGTRPRSFALARVEDFASIGEHGRRLQLVANDRPKDAVAGATELVESVCRAVLHATGAPAPGKAAGLVALAKATLKALKPVPAGSDQLAAVIATLGEPKALSPRHARLAAGVAVAFAGFIAETYADHST